MQLCAVGLGFTLAAFGVAPSPSAAAATAYGPTPQRALLAAYREAKPAPAILLVNTVGRFAIVVARGGYVDQLTHSPTSAYLLERFSFGWQPLDVVLDDCLLGFRGISAADQRRLLAGMHVPYVVDVCNRVVHDVGPAADIAVLRARMSGPMVPSVVISGQYAYAQEYGDGGGCGLFRRAGSGWTLLSGCKGSPNPSVLATIPTSTLCALGLDEYARAKCPGR
jgi:hypothetical protein